MCNILCTFILTLICTRNVRQKLKKCVRGWYMVNPPLYSYFLSDGPNLWKYFYTNVSAQGLVRWIFVCEKFIIWTYTYKISAHVMHPCPRPETPKMEMPPKQAKIKLKFALPYSGFHNKNSKYKQVEHAAYKKGHQGSAGVQTIMYPRRPSCPKNSQAVGNFPYIPSLGYQ